MIAVGNEVRVMGVDWFTKGIEEAYAFPDG